MVLEYAERLGARCLPPHRGLRAVVGVPACSRRRWTSSVTSPCAALVARPGRAAMRSAAAAARPPEAAPCVRGGRPPSLAAVWSGMRDDRRPISPSLRQPVVPRRESQAPLLLHPTRSCAACPGGSVPCGGGGRGAT